ncbi:MAG: tetratricopeptide repeat protein [Ginsengibacter sp.]
MKNSIIFLSLYFTAMSGFSQNIDSAVYFFQKGKEEKAAGRFAVAAQYFSKSIANKPNYTEAYVESGKTNLQMRRIYDAQKDFARAYELAPSDPDIIQEMTMLYFNNRQFQKAIEFAQKCKNCKESDRILGMSYYHTEDYGKAQTLLEKSLAVDNKDAEAAYTLGRTYLELENEKKAIPQFVNAIANDNSRNVWMYELALIYYSLNDFKNAIKYFDMAANSGYNKTNDFYENLGFAQLYTGNIENGIQNLTEVLNRKPNNKELLGNIANAMYETKRYDAALEYFQKLLELNPNDASSLYMAGMVFQKKGEKEKGQKICDKAIEMDPSLAKNRQKKELPMGL